MSDVSRFFYTLDSNSAQIDRVYGDTAEITTYTCTLYQAICAKPVYVAAIFCSYF